MEVFGCGGTITHNQFTQITESPAKTNLSFINHLEIIHDIAVAEGSVYAELDAETDFEIEIYTFKIPAVDAQAQHL